MAWTEKCGFKYPETWEEWDQLVQGPIHFRYGLPEIVDLTVTEFGPTRGVEVQPKWELPEKLVIISAVTGSFLSRRQNPNIPYTAEEIRRDAEECLQAGSPSVHIHARDEKGLPSPDIKLYHEIMDPLKEKYPDHVIDACCSQGKTHREGLAPVEEGLLEIAPVNVTAVYCGDTLRASPPSWIMAKTEYIQRRGAKPLVAVYDTGDIDSVNRYLIKTGILEKPYYWGIVPAIPGCTPMPNPKAMMQVLLFYFERIKEIDPDSIINVCGCGRASSYLTTAAILLGTHSVRVGMEDSIYKYPDKNDRITSNVEEFNRTKQIAQLLGREIATGDDYRRLIGLIK
ncbi:3-keto-5-aminohexanoate cleavage protein [Chloroflexota bacterium]